MGKGLFHCLPCEKNFANKQSLQYHTNNKHGGMLSDSEKEAKYFCKICDKMVVRGKHIEDYHNPKDGNLKCPKCGKILSNFESAHNHITRRETLHNLWRTGVNSKNEKACL